jgi:hypothetical protein
MQKRFAVCLLAMAVGGSCVRNSTPNYAQANKLGLNYSTTVFDVSVSGSRPLGTNENYRIVGSILPVEKRITLGESFELRREDIISFTGVLTEADKDHLRLAGHFKGLGPANHPLDIDIDGTIALGIHGGIFYFRDDRYAAAAPNDCLEIKKVKLQKP